MNASKSRLQLPRAIDQLIYALQLLPGIGPKTARRLAFFLVNSPESVRNTLAQRILNLNSGLKRCSFCNVISETDPCSICGGTQADPRQLIVVRSSLHLVSIEKTDTYNGYYFVLTDPEADQKKLARQIKYLLNLQRNQNQTPKLEIIFAFGGSFDEEALIIKLKEFINSNFNPKQVEFSRFAIGLQPGADIDFVDAYTIKQSYLSRQKI